MDFDAVWDRWMAAGHGDCGGWRHDPGPAVVTCACGTVIAAAAMTTPEPQTPAPVASSPCSAPPERARMIRRPGTPPGGGTAA